MYSSNFDYTAVVMTLKLLLVCVSVGISLPLLPSCKGVSPEPPVRKRLMILIRVGLRNFEYVARF